MASSDAAVKPSGGVGRARTLSVVNKSAVDGVMEAEVRSWLLDVLCAGPTSTDDPLITMLSDKSQPVASSLRDGVLLQFLLQRLTMSVEERASVPFSSLKRPKVGGFQSRDSVSRFIRALAKEPFNLRTEVLFDDCDLCDGRNDRAVITTLLALSKAAYHRGLVAPPPIIAFEVEIDKQAQVTTEADIAAAIVAAPEESETEDDEEPEVPIAVSAPAVAVERHVTVEPAAAVTQVEPAPAAVQVEAAPAAAVEAAEVEAPDEVSAVEPPTDDAIVDPKSLKPLTAEQLAAARPGNIHRALVRVMLLAKKRRPELEQIRLIRTGIEGQYVVFHKVTKKRNVIYIRSVQTNLMVRVGGGWEAFEPYLQRRSMELSAS